MIIGSKILRCAVVVVLGLWSGTAWGQNRLRYAWNVPDLQERSHIGGNLSRYGAGVGGLRRSTPAESASLLRSSIPDVGNYALRRSTASGGLTGLAGQGRLPRLSTPGGLSYRGVGLKLRPPEAVRGVPALLPAIGTEGVTSIVGMARGSQDKPLESGRARPIHSLVPVEPSIYQQRLERGDMAFRNGRYQHAVDEFQIADSIVRYSPESHLSLVHGLFALAEYHRASYHLRKALEYFPELPLAQLEIREFYGQDSRGDFDEHFGKLQKKTQGEHADTDALLVQAYIRYFDGQPDEAAASLRAARTRAALEEGEEVKEAIEIFWDGMVTAGRLSKSLPTSQPTSQPADDAATRGASESPREPAEPSTPKPEHQTAHPKTGEDTAVPGADSQ